MKKKFKYLIVGIILVLPALLGTYCPLIITDLIDKNPLSVINYLTWLVILLFIYLAICLIIDSLSDY